MSSYSQDDALRDFVAGKHAKKLAEMAELLQAKEPQGRCVSQCMHPIACSGLDKCVRQNTTAGMSDEEIDRIAGSMYCPLGVPHPSRYTYWCREFARAVLAASLLHSHKTKEQDK